MKKLTIKRGIIVNIFNNISKLDLVTMFIELKIWFLVVLEMK